MYPIWISKILCWSSSNETKQMWAREEYLMWTSYCQKINRAGVSSSCSEGGCQLNSAEISAWIWLSNTFVKQSEERGK